MFFLFLLVLLIYSNVRIAKKKGKNLVLWGIVSLIAFFLSFFLLGSLYLGIVYKGVLTPEALALYLKNEPFAGTVLFLLGVGGVLIIRFVLERMKVEKAG